MLRRLSALAPVLALLIATAAGAAVPSLLAPLSDGTALPLPQLDPAVPSPSAFLGYPLGQRFTPHARIVAYFEALAEASPRVHLSRYGETYEGRPLLLAAISTPETIARLDAVQAEHARLVAAPHRLSTEERRRLQASAPAVVWLGYGVHGNESSSAEAAMATAYVLAAGGGAIADQLQDVVVLVDPLVNPDGRDRYVHLLAMRQGMEPNPDPDAAEHFEPWPGGRGNHYFIDLNRDWAWATQTETRQRLAAFRAWEPQVYVDFHEMFPDSTYFFPPPAEPVHAAVGPAQRRLLDRFGRGNAAAFENLGWLYYVGEQFDLFYPAYGDSYPTLRGGIGMTYEMAGHGRAATAIDLPWGGRLTLADRVARHFTTSLATVATAATGREEVLTGFVESRLSAATRPGRTYLWSAGQPEAAELAELLALHGIEVGVLGESAQLAATPFRGGATQTRVFPAGTWAASSAQPLGHLVDALLERDPEMPAGFLERQRERAERHESPQFFDVTAWALPLAFNLEAWVADGPAPRLAGAPAAPGIADLAPARLGYLVPPQGLATYRFLGEALAAGAEVRVALDPLGLGGRDYPAGTLFLARRPSEPDQAAVLGAAAARAGVEVVPVDAGYGATGISLGSERMLPVVPPRIGLVFGPGVDSTSFGFLWHLLDVDVDVPHSLIDLAALGQVELGRFDTLILPDGGYGRTLGEDGAARLAAWVEAGGTLVAIGAAAEWLGEREVVAARREAEPEPSEEAEGEAGREPWDTERLLAGAVLATESEAHPVTVGLPGPPPVLFWGHSFVTASGDPQIDLLRARAEDPVLAGTAWEEGRQSAAGSLLVWQEDKGAGRVVLFAQDPAFRLFWRGTMPLVLNAALYGPSLTARWQLR